MTFTKYFAKNNSEGIIVSDNTSDITFAVGHNLPTDTSNGIYLISIEDEIVEVESVAEDSTGNLIASVIRAREGTEFYHHAADTTGKLLFTAGAMNQVSDTIVEFESKLNLIDVTGNINLDEIYTDTQLNNAKVTNATHDGEVLGDTTLTLDISAITNKTEESPSDNDYLLFYKSDSETLNKSLFDKILGNVTNSNSSEDRCLIISDGTDGRNIQPTDIIIDTSGNITNVGTINGRDLIADGAKLDELNLTELTVTDEEIETGYNNRVSVVDQTSAELGTSNTVYRWTPQRVAQAIDSRIPVMSVNSQTGDVVLNSDDISDTSSTNKFATQSQLNKINYIDVTSSINLDTLSTAVALNTLKVTNATHSGDASGSTTLTLQPTAISGKTAKNTLEVTDELLILDNDTTSLKKSKIENLLDLTQSSSGVLSGGVLSIGTGGSGVATTFSITDGSGYIVDTTVSPWITHLVEWSGKTNVSVTDMTSNIQTFVGIDLSGNVVQSSTEFDSNDFRSYIVIGSVIHPNGSTVLNIQQSQIPVYGGYSHIKDLYYALKPFNIEGNVFSANGSNLSVNKSSGKIYKFGGNYTSHSQNPSVIELAGLTPANIRMVNQSGNLSDSTTILDITHYDVNGVSTPVNPNKYTIIRLYSCSTNIVFAARGQAFYGSLAEAISAIQSENFVTNPLVKSEGVLRAFLCVSSSATSLADTSKAKFIEAGKFGTSAGVGSIPVSTLQTSYNNSIQPEIITNDTHGAITLQCGSASNSDNVLEILDLSGSTVLSINGLGNVSLTGTVDGRNLSTDGAKLDFIDVTSSVNLNTLSTAVALNTLKETNATHSGDVSGATTLTINPSAISGKTEVTPATGDYVLLLDATDGTLKKGLINNFITAYGDVTGPASSTTNAIAVYNGTDGKVIKNTGITIDASNNITGIAAITASGAATFTNNTQVGNSSTNAARYLDLITDTSNRKGVRFYRGSGVKWVLQSDTDHSLKILRYDTTSASFVAYDFIIDGTSGNISISGTIDGRDLAVDGAKLDGIQAGAQVNTITADSTSSFTNKTVKSRVVNSTVDSTSINYNADNGDIFNATLTGNTQLKNPTGTLYDGQKIIHRIRTGTGNFALTYDTLYRFSTDVPQPTLITTATKLVYLLFMYNSTDNKLDLISINQGF